MFLTIGIIASPKLAPDIKKVALGTAMDSIMGVAILIIGIVATQTGFLPNSVQYALIGAGGTYFFGMLCAMGTIYRLTNFTTKNK